MEEDFGGWADSDLDGADGGIRILHVDDKPTYTALTAELLERESAQFDVISANSAAAGLDRLEEESVDCVVSDYQMPGQSGLEFYERVAADHEDLPFILFTGKGSEEVASEAFSLGVTDYLQKKRGTDQFTVLANRIEQAVESARSRRRLAQTRRRFKTLVEEANDAILVVDSTGRILYATPASNHILGRSPAELVGSDGFDPIHPDDVDRLETELLRLLDDPAHTAQADVRYTHADGSTIWIEVRGRNLLADDDIAGIVVYVRDIDERKSSELALEQREKTFRAVFEEASEAMVIADDDGVYVDANPAACDLFGLERDALLGRTVQDFLPDDFDFEAAWERFQRTERDRGTVPLVAADGEHKTLEFAATADILPNRHLAIFRDVSDRAGSKA